MTSLPQVSQLLSRFDPLTGTIAGASRVERRLADLRGCFADTTAFEAAVAQGNPLVYSVAAVEPGSGEGDLHYGLGVLMPGRIGREYWMTKGHLHAWRPAAEFYIGLSGKGVMLLEDEAGGEARMVPLEPNSVVYVPGHVAHRTMNTGDSPLAYLGVYPARAGHDYAVIAERNFRHLVVEAAGRPVLERR
ncbi:MAG: glucose-6-phosphate isomerase family protein [Opitutaceae bacterium]|nr:glucose-6-phosphate isomerase family protein [Opitutaceae bacterium]